MPSPPGEGEIRQIKVREINREETRSRSETLRETRERKKNAREEEQWGALAPATLPARSRAR
jgi:hypothetical protein